MYTKIIHSYKILIIIILALSTSNAKGQCTITSSPTCMTALTPITFSSTNPPNSATHWRVLDVYGNIIFNEQPSSTFTFPTSGVYIIQPGYIDNITNVFTQSPTYVNNVPVQPIPDNYCEQIITIGEDDPTINFSTNSITICSGSAIMLADSITNNLYTIDPTYNWTTSNGNSYNDLYSSIYFTTETMITLTMTDITGCTDSTDININYATNPSLDSLFSITPLNCGGDTFTLIVEPLDTSNVYSWHINGEVISADSITTNINAIIPNQAQDIQIVLYSDDGSGNCPIYNIQNLEIPATSFVTLDTLTAQWSTTENAFVGCVNLPYSLTLNIDPNNNIDPNTIDSLVINWISISDSQTVVQNSNFSSITGTVDENTTHVLITTYTDSGCANTISYNLIFNSWYGGNAASDFSKSCGSSCLGSEISFGLDVGEILPPNGIIRFIIGCTQWNSDTIYWDYDQYIQNFDSINVSSCNDATAIMSYKSVFQYTFNEPSCNCDITDPNYYFIETHVMNGDCGQYIPTGSQKVRIRPDPTPDFIIPPIMCEDSTFEITNNSFFGCDSLESNPLEPNDSAYFAYYFSDSCDPIIDSVYTSNGFNSILHTYNNPGTYTIRIETNSSCKDTSFTSLINVYPKPNVSFTSNTVCLGDTTSFISNVSTENHDPDTIICPDTTIIIPVPEGDTNNLIYTWTGLSPDSGTFISGNINHPNPQFIFNSCGEHIVSLTITDGNTCDTTYTDTIQVLGIPQAGYLIDPVCEGASTVFTDTSTINLDCSGAPIDYWIWNFGDGSPIDSSQFPTHTYTPICNPNDIDTSYITSLTITDTNGCVSTASDTAIVYCNPVAEFDSTAIICFEAPNFGQITLLNQSTPINGVDFQWTFPDGTTSDSINPTYTFLTSGEHVIILTLSGNNCSDSISHTITVWQNPQILITDSININCYGTSTGAIITTTTNGLPPYTYIWDNGITTQNLNNLAAGTYIVTVSDSNQCISTDSVTLTEQSLLEVTSNTTPTTCFQGDDGTATATPFGGLPPYSYLWSDGQTTQTAIGLLQGIYSCTITDSLGCDTTIQINITEPTQITNTIYESICNGDSALINGIYYNSLGIYTDTVINSFGCDSILFIDIDTFPGPFALINNNATSLSNCAPFEINSTILSAGIFPNYNNDYFWYIDSAGYQIDTSHTIIPPAYTMNVDNYSVTIYLITNNIYDCPADTASIMFTTILNPIAAFTLDALQGCNPLTVNIDTSGTTQNVNYSWELIDQNGNIVQTYNTHQSNITLTNTSNNTDSTYTIRFTVTDGNGCDSTITSNTITVFHNPLADFTTSDNAVCAPATISVDATSSITGNNLEYIWSTIDVTPTILDSTSVITTIDFIDNQTGNSNFYDIQLIVTDNITGCSHNTSSNVELYTRPISLFYIDSIDCGPTSITPNNNSVYATGSPNFNWTITNPLIGWTINNNNTANPPILFDENIGPDSTNYIIELTAITDNQCTDTSNDTVTIYPTPLVSFEASDTIGCGPLNISFTNTSTPQNQEDILSMSFSWYIDGIYQTDSTNFTNIFANIPQDTICYTIVLVGETQHGCISSDTTIICVYPDPMAELNFDNLPCQCAPLNIGDLLIEANNYPQANSGINWTIVNSNGNIVTNGTGLNCPNWTMYDQDDFVWIYIDAYNDCGNTQDSIYVCTTEDPIAAFTLDALQGCNPLTVNIDTSGTTQNVNYSWEVIDQNGNIVQTYNTHQSNITLTNTSNNTDSTYTIRLTTGDPNTGCDSTITSNTITVFPIPLANIITNNVCDSIEAIFYDDSDSTNVPITYWQWNFGDGTTDTVQNPTPYIYTGWGDFYPSLTIIDLNGCQDIDTDTITIWPNPIANFDTTYSCLLPVPDSLCADEIIVFNNTSSLDPFGGNLEWESWYVNNSLADSNLYTVPFDTSLNTGLYTITNFIYSDNGCVDSISNTIQVVDIPVSTFEINDSLCINDTPIYVDSNLSNGYISTYEWIIYDSTGINQVWNSGMLNWVDGNSNIPTFPSLLSSLNPETYLISLTVSNCCGDSTYIDTLTITPLPNIDFYTEPYDCGPNTQLMLGTPLVLFWEGNGFNNPEYTDSIIVNWGNGNIDTLYPYPDTNNLAVFWENPSNAYLNLGIYDIWVVGYNNCGTDSVPCQIEIVPSDILSQFEVLDSNLTCQDSCIYFRETSVNYNYTNSTVNWWFNWDPLIYPTAQQPDISIPFVYDTIICHNYNEPGIYIVLHEIIGDSMIGTPYDTSFNQFDTIMIYPLPSIQIDNCQPICNLDSIIIENNTTINDSIPGMTNQGIALANCQWYINDNPITSNWDLLFTPTIPGNYWIKLKVWSNLGCYSVDSCEIIVYDLPQPDFYVIPDTICLGGLTVFADNTTILGSGGNPTSWIWEYGDSTSDTLYSLGATHEYNLPGDYIVEYTIIDSYCSNSTQETINIAPNITGFFTSTTVCEGTPTFIDGSASTNTTDEWLWDLNSNGVFTDSTDRNGETIYHTFNSAGWNVVSLLVRDYLTNDVCQDTIQDSIYVYSKPTAYFESTIECLNDTTSFDNQSVPGVDADITSYSWILYDTPIDTSTIFEPKHQFNTPGTFIVSLSIIDTNLCTAIYIDSNIVVATLPTAIISDTSLCDSTQIQLIDESIDGTYNINNWLWDISNMFFTLGTDSTTQNPWVQFYTYGNNQGISLIITDDLGCNDTTTAYVNVYQNPLANFYIDTLLYSICSNDSIRIIDNSDIPSGSPISLWNWNFGFNGNPSNSNSQNNTILYTNTSGPQDIIQYIEDENGCSNINHGEIYLNTPPTASFTATNICANEEVVLTNTSTASSDAPIDYISWLYIDSIPVPSVDSSHYYTSVNQFEGAYASAMILVTDLNNCSATSVIDSIEIHPIPNIGFTTDPICENENLVFCDTSSFGNNNAFPLDILNTYNWLFNNIIDSSIQPPNCFELITNDILYPAATYPISLTIETNFISEVSNSNCSNTLLGNVKIIDNPEMTIDTNYLAINPPCGDNIELNFETSHNHVSNFNYQFVSSPISYIYNSVNDFNISLPNPDIYLLDILLENQENGKTCQLRDTIFFNTYPQPSASFIFEQGYCENDLICFINNTQLNIGLNYLDDLVLLDNSTLNDTVFIETYDWDFDDGRNIINDSVVCDTFNANFGEPTWYSPSLNIITNQGCSSSFSADSFLISPSPIANIFTPIQQVPNHPGEFYLDGSNSTTSDGSDLSYFDWDFIWNINGSEQINILPTPDLITWQFPVGATYYPVDLIIINQQTQCSDTASIEHYVNYFKGLQVPNALTANINNEATSLFWPKGKALEEYRLQIFDIWGNIIWESTDLDDTGSPTKESAWDGTINGTPAPQGTYVWKIYARFSDGEIWLNKEGKNTGPVYLIR